MEADDHARGLFIDRLNDVFVNYQPESAVAAGVRFRADMSSLSVSKSCKLAGDRLQMSYRFSGEAVGEGVFSTEINLAMPSCDGWGGRYIHQGKIPGGFGQPLELAAMTEITLDDDVLAGSITLSVSSPVAFRAQPHHSVSQSEGGFEKIMQAVTLQLEWLVTIEELVITLEISAQRKEAT